MKPSNPWLSWVPAQTFPNHNGRPMYVLDDRDPVVELLQL